ncbi:hypothetical protein FNU76_01590 [Chitinimonas arctica]|uniref:S9 family peptidase n=1 Tax=Chitinimonas arctica TaxID=2594795 RepID=A0A516SAI0_9NEIS|nr:hypothetical protein [Chitinimonas arctica]QDQ25153.1 hypothetical protein FNU76_01590 [Chitinimonas arctica]
MIVKHFFGTVLLAAMTLAVAAESEPPKVEAFFSNPQLDHPILSPSGKHLAMRVRGENGRMALGVFETDNFQKKSAAALQPVIVAAYTNIDVDHVRWINDNRLYFDFEDSKDESNKIPGSAFAVNRDGSQRTQLMTKEYQYVQEAIGSHIKQRVLPWDYSYYTSLHDGSDDIIVKKNTYSKIDYTITSSRLYRLNTKTRLLTHLIEAG